MRIYMSYKECRLIISALMSVIDALEKPDAEELMHLIGRIEGCTELQQNGKKSALTSGEKTSVG